MVLFTKSMTPPLLKILDVLSTISESRISSPSNAGIVATNNHGIIAATINHRISLLALTRELFILLLGPELGCTSSDKSRRAVNSQVACLLFQLKPTLVWHCLALCGSLVISLLFFTFYNCLYRRCQSTGK